MTALDLFGYVGSVLVELSLMMSNIKRLRWINLIGAAAFSLYGLLIGATPVFVLNGWIVLVNIYYLIRLYQFKDDFDLVHLISTKTELFELLMEKYGDDIRSFFPSIDREKLDAATALLIFRNMKPVGLFAFMRHENDPQTVDVLIDYVIPESRDFKTAKFLFDRHTTELKEENISTLISNSERPGHIDYLMKMGFTRCDDGLKLEI